MSQISSFIDPQADSFLLNLPLEMSYEIFFFLDPKALVKYSATCKKANTLVHSHLQECVSRSSKALAALRERVKKFHSFWRRCPYRIVVEHPIFQGITNLTKQPVTFKPLSLSFGSKDPCKTWKTLCADIDKNYTEIVQAFEHLRPCCPQLSFPWLYKREELVGLLRAIWLGVSCFNKEGKDPYIMKKFFQPYYCQHKKTPSHALLDPSELTEWRKLGAPPQFQIDWIVQIYNATLIHGLVEAALEEPEESAEDLCAF